MSGQQFVHLHLHTQYSLLDGANKLPDILQQAHNFGQPAIAMTDHGNLHGAIEFYLEAKKIGIKPIIGCELYVTPGSRLDRKAKNHGGAGINHLTVLASNLEGYHNLCRLVSLANREGFYFKPRVDHEILERYSAGLIVLSGCLSSELSSFAEIDDEKGANQLVEFYAKTFSGRYYLEVQPHIIPEQQKLNQVCEHLASKFGLPMVATTDCHYPNKDDHYAQEVLMCVSTGKHVTDPDRMQHKGVHLHLKTAAEMKAEFGTWKFADEVLANAVKIAESCNVKFDHSKYFMPVFKTEEQRPLIEIMAEKARAGLERRIAKFVDLSNSSSDKREKNFWTSDLERQYKDRLELEIKLIDKMGFAGYFLVVSDFIVWAKEHDIPVGPGRGSCAGSLVAYAMRITEVDPIRHKLLFERFLNPDRISLPDIDVDFCIYGRDKVIKYVVEKYGKENVAQIATFGTLKAKAAIKDVGRALGLSYAETDKVAQLIPAPRQGFDYSIAESIQMEKRLADYAAGEGKELISLAMKLEGLTRHSSTHAAGVVIGDRPLIDLLPMMVDKDGNDVTQYSMTYVEKIGLVKFDFLGLKTLTVIYTALQIIKESRGIDLDLLNVSLEDPAVFQVLSSGNTTGVFQLESSGITEMTVRLKPSCFDDIVAILALYRPGPLDAGMVDHYIERKHGREKVTYLHPLMKDSLADTYGIILYQEQIMQLARALSGYSLAEADILRKAMGKKNPEEMAKQRERFMKGAIDRKIDKNLASEIFDQMETFARYGFNRSHSAAYAMVSYQTAYLKTHYSVEFMAALMSHELDDSDKTLKNLNECRKQKIEVLPPDVNESIAGFSVKAGKVRYGLSAVKGVGEKAVESIVKSRATGKFVDLEDFVGRIDLHAVNRRVIENFIKCGAFDFCGFSRRELFERVDDVLKYGQSLQRQDNSNQISLFAAAGQKQQIPKRQSNKPEWPVNQRLSLEREALGFYISGHPLEKFKRDLKRLGVINTADIIKKARQADTRVSGVVTALKLKNTKKGDRYASFMLEDYTGSVEALIWPDVYRQVAQIIASEDPVICTGRPDVSEERCTFIINKVESLVAIRDKSATQGLLALTDSDNLESRIDPLLSILRRHSGNCPLKVKMELDGAEVFLQLKDQSKNMIAVSPSEALCEEIEQIFGRPVLSFF